MGERVSPGARQDLGSGVRDVVSRAKGVFPPLGLTAALVVDVLGVVVWSVLWPVLGSGPGVYAGLLATAVLTSVGQVFVVGCVSVAADRAAEGRSTTGADVWTRVGPVKWRLLGLSLCCGVAVPVGLVLGVVPGLLAWVGSSLAAPVLVLERTTVRQALARSRALVAGAWWRTLRVLLFATAAAVVPIAWLTYLTAPSLRHLDVAARSATAPVGWLLFTAVPLTVFSGLLLPFAAAAVGALYVDRRASTAT